MNKQDRIDKEYKLAGGMKNFKELTDEEHNVLEEQFHVLSYVRESGELVKAAEEAKVPFVTIGMWIDANVLDFTSRYTITRQHVGFQIESRVINGLMNGDIKNPSLFKIMLDSHLPDFYGNKAVKPESAALETLTELRKFAAENAAQEKEEPETPAEPEEAQEPSEPVAETPEDQTKIIDLLKRRQAQ